MDWWLVKQLRARAILDLGNHLPTDFFTQDERLRLSPQIKGTEHYSGELSWGAKAGKLGRKLFFEQAAPMSPRQVAASELLMNLGLLAGAEAAHGATSKLAAAAGQRGQPDGNAGSVAADLRTNKLPQLEQNVRGTLERYIPYLPAEEQMLFTAVTVR